MARSPWQYAHLLLLARLLLEQDNFISVPVEFRQGLALHLQLHLRVFLEDLRVSLAKHLCDPLVAYTSSAEPRGVSRAQIVNAKIRYLGSSQCCFPGESGLVRGKKLQG